MIITLLNLKIVIFDSKKQCISMQAQGCKINIIVKGKMHDVWLLLRRKIMLHNLTHFFYLTTCPCWKVQISLNFWNGTFLLTSHHSHCSIDLRQYFSKSHQSRERTRCILLFELAIPLTNILCSNLIYAGFHCEDSSIKTYYPTSGDSRLW